MNRFRGFTFCAACGKHFDIGEQVFLDERLDNYKQGWFHKRCQPEEKKGEKDE